MQLGSVRTTFADEVAAARPRVTAVVTRLAGDDAQKLRDAYRTLYGRLPTGEEIDLGLSFLRKSNWKEYARVLLNANEFLWVN